MNDSVEVDANVRELMEKHAELRVKKLELKAEMAQVHAEALKSGVPLEAVGQMRCW